MCEHDILEHLVITPTVMAVAVKGKKSDWAAFIGHHCFMNVKEVIETICLHGDKVDQGLAELLFPKIKEQGLKYRE